MCVEVLPSVQHGINFQMVMFCRGTEWFFIQIKNYIKVALFEYYILSMFQKIWLMRTMKVAIY